MQSRRLVSCCLALGLALAAGQSRAEEISTDITVDLSGTLVRDEDVVADPGGSPGLIDLGTLPANADLIGHTLAANGDELFTLDVAVALPGGIDATPRDVVRWNGALYSIEFAGADHGVSDGAKIDAIGLLGGDLLLSFDVALTLGGVAAADEDLLRLEDTTPDVWSLHFDGSAKGVPDGADLDGADVIDATGNLALSFDVSGSIDGVAFDDEDVLEFAAGSGAWSKRFDGSAADAALAAADVDAVLVPEPGAAAVVACAALAALKARRRGQA